MKFTRARIPLGHAWSTPFSRWQGPLAELSSVDLAVIATSRALESRGLDPARIGYYVLGTTVPQRGSFYGVTAITRRLGAPAAAGPVIAQACATSVACIEAAAAQVELGAHDLAAALLADRTSNGPLLSFPAPSAPGGAPRSEHWVLDNMQCDPGTGESMLDTAEHVAAEAGLCRAELDDLTMLRYEQYEQAVTQHADIRARYLVPVTVSGRKAVPGLDDDFGVHPTTRAGLAGLEPVRPGGVVTYGSQTHPADGAAGAVIASREQARALAPEGCAQILATAFARVAPARMPAAPVPAARRALSEAGLELGAVDVVTTHSPFAVNDAYFCRETGFPAGRMNPYGCSLVYGHPQGPTGARAIAELIEALRARGGGVGLFTGCAAGDTAGAVVIRVDDR